MYLKTVLKTPTGTGTESQIHSYPLQGKIQAYNKIVKNEFLAIEEDIPNIDDGKLRYDMFVKA